MGSETTAEIKASFIRGGGGSGGEWGCGEVFKITPSAAVRVIDVCF